MKNNAVPATILFFSFAASVNAQVDVVELTAKQISEGYAADSFTAVEVTEAYLRRIEEYESNYNAFTFLNDKALADAAALDEEYRTRGPRSPLHGVPVVIKETIDVMGFPATAGYAPLSSEVGGVDLFPVQDATVTAKLKAAGAIILGKTNVPALASNGTRTSNTSGGMFDSWDGATRNAYDRTLAPGASSAGTATAVAANFGALGLAAESAGSIQNPAGAQALVGVKPTAGLVSNAGSVPGSSPRSVIGPIAKTVFDAALSLDFLAGPSPDDPTTLLSEGHIPPNGYTHLLTTTALEGKRIGTFGNGWRVDESPTAETKQLYDTALEVIQAQGASLVEDPFSGSGFNQLAENWGRFGDLRGNDSIIFDFEKYFDRILTPEDGRALDELKRVSGVDLFGPDGVYRGFVDTFPIVSESLKDPDALPDLSEFEAIRDEYRDVFSSVMDEHDLDALVFPQMLSRTPTVSSTTDIVASSVSAINIMGTPGVTVPAGSYGDGAPFSIIFLGEQFSEPELLGFAYDFEQATQHRTPPKLFHLADFDENGSVGFEDFLLISDNFGKRGPRRRGDLNDDRMIDFADFLLLSSQFGLTNDAVFVPEPDQGLVLIWLSFVSFSMLRKRELACQSP